MEGPERRRSQNPEGGISRSRSSQCRQRAGAVPTSRCPREEGALEKGSDRGKSKPTANRKDHAVPRGSGLEVLTQVSRNGSTRQLEGLEGNQGAMPRPAMQSGEGQSLVQGGGSLHELPNIAAHGEKLRVIHAADDVTDDGCQHPCCSCHAEVG